MSSDPKNLNYEQGITVIEEKYIGNIINYLKSGKLNHSNKNFMQVYDIVLAQCDEMDNAKDLFQYYVKTCTNYIKGEILPTVRQKSGAAFLKEYTEQWRKYTLLAHYVAKIFNYLDRYHLKNSNMNSLAANALQIFHDECFIGLRETLRQTMFDQLGKDRNGELVDRQVLKEAITCFVQIGLQKAATAKEAETFSWKGDRNLHIYDTEFEAQFLANIKVDYERKANQWNAQMNCPEYLKQVYKHLQHEETNADYWLQPETKPKMLQKVEHEVVTKPAEQVVEKDTGCRYMFEHARLEELALLYKVLKRDEQTLNYVIKRMNPYIEDRGTKIVMDENLLKDPIQFTQKLLELKKEMDNMIENSFNNDMKFQKGRDTSFQNFMNSCNMTPGYMAQYTDFELKRGLKGLSNEETEDRLDAIVRLFCCLHGRDTFIKAYTKFLSGRLLNKTSISSEAEESMLQKLKVECGVNTTNKISQMFTDMKLSKDLQNDFKNHCKGDINIGNVTFQAEMLTNGNWPIDKQPICNIPAELKACTSRFETFYKNKHQNRNVSWLYKEGQVELLPKFTQKNFQLITNCFQATVLCLFNQHQILTVTEIKDKTGIEMEFLTPALLNLCAPKLKILQKEVNKPKFEPNEKIQVNVKFSNPNIRVNFIPAPATKKKTTEATAEDVSLAKEIKQERGMIIDANIVKIMKTRKTESHQALIQGVLHNISMFQAQPAQIKQRIESLIEREYMKRDEKNKGTYIYLP